MKAIWLVFTGDLEKTLGQTQESDKETQSDKEMMESSSSTAEMSATESFCEFICEMHKKCSTVNC